MTETRKILENGGADYEDALDRLDGNAAFYERLAVKYLNNDNYDALVAALEKGDLEAAARESHSLKGTAGNLSFSALHQAATQVNTALRAGDEQSAREGMAAVSSAHIAIVEALKKLA